MKKIVRAHTDSETAARRQAAQRSQKKNIVRAHGAGEILATETSGNGTAKKTKPPRRRNPATPQLSEKTKKLTLKAFRLAYEAHHGKSS